MTNEIVWKVEEEEWFGLTEGKKIQHRKRGENVQDVKGCQREKMGSVNVGRGGGGSRGRETLLLYPDISKVLY